MEMFIRVLKIHCKKNEKAKKIIKMYETGQIVLRDCLLGIIETLDN